MPILAYANFTKTFKLYTNACGPGLGDFLYQAHDDRTDVIISYVSRSLIKTKTLFPVHKLEFLTL